VLDVAVPCVKGAPFLTPDLRHEGPLYLWFWGVGFAS